MFKRYILSTILTIAFTIPSYATDITVPKGALPMPGTDSTVPANRYENYWHSNETAEREAQLWEEELWSMPPEQEDNYLRFAQQNPGYAKAQDLANFSQSTVILLHDNTKLLRIVVPDVSMRGDVVDRGPNQEPLYAIRTFTGFIMVGPPHGSALHRYTKQSGRYTYPNLDDAKWSLLSSSAHVMHTDFKTVDTGTSYGITYGRLQNDTNPYQDQSAEYVMTNYIIPSIDTLNDFDTYSKMERWGNLTYRVPTMATLASESIENKRYEVRTYRDTGFTIRLLRWPVLGDTKKYTIANDNTMWFLYKYKGFTTPTQYAMVWNNGIPGFLVDRYESNKPSYLRMVSSDGIYNYSYRIDYDAGVSPYTHMQLRNMVEYMDFNHVDTFRNTIQWQVKGRQKNSFETDSVFIPWYMQWIELMK